MILLKAIFKLKFFKLPHLYLCDSCFKLIQGFMKIISKFKAKAIFYKSLIKFFYFNLNLISNPLNYHI